MMDGGTGGWGAGDWLAMSAVMILFWGALIALAVWGVRFARTDRGSTGAADPAEAVLAARFASGEIDAEEFTRGRELLYSGSASHSHRGR